MSDLQTIRAAMAAALTAVGTDVQVSPYMLAQPTPPTLQVIPGEQTYDLAMARGADLLTFTIQGLASIGEGISTQQLLDQLMAPAGARSVKAALEADRTLGGVVANVRATTCSGYTATVHPSGAWMLLCEWTAEVYNQN